MKQPDVSKQPERLKKLIDSAGLKPAELAKEISVSRAAISQFLNGKNAMNEKTAKNIVQCIREYNTPYKGTTPPEWRIRWQWLYGLDDFRLESEEISALVKEFQSRLQNLMIVSFDLFRGNYAQREAKDKQHLYELYPISPFESDYAPLTDAEVSDVTADPMFSVIRDSLKNEVFFPDVNSGLDIEIADNCMTTVTNSMRLPFSYDAFLSLCDTVSCVIGRVMVEYMKQYIALANQMEMDVMIDDEELFNKHKQDIDSLMYDICKPYRTVL